MEPISSIKVELISTIFKAIKLCFDTIAMLFQVIGIDVTGAEVAIITIIVFALLGLIVIIRKKCKR